MSKQGYVLTAGHVIRGLEANAKANGASKVVIEVGLLLDLSSTSNVHFQGSFDWTEAIVVEIDDLHDLAILKVSRNPFTGEMTSGIQVAGNIIPLKARVARLDAALPPEGSDVLISGYPLDIPTFVTQRGMVASESFTVRESPLQGAPPGFTKPDVQDSILLDAVVNPGNSGGPVYDSNSGEVIGVCEAYESSPLFTNKLNQVHVAPEEVLTQNAGLAVVIPIKYGIQLLRKNGVSDFLASQTDSSPKIH